MAAKTSARTIAHALFWYADPDQPKVERMARRGDTVDLLEADIARGEAHGAFTGKVGAEPEVSQGTLLDFPAEGSEADQDAWVTSGKVDEVVDYVRAHPEHVDLVLAAEQRRGDSARKTLLESLATVAGGQA